MAKMKMWCGQCGKERPSSDPGRCECGCNWRSSIPAAVTSVQTTANATAAFASAGAA